MKALFKLFVGLGALFLIVVLALAITVATLDPNDHKDWIAEQAMESTGRTLTLDGDIEVSVYPWLGIKTSKVTMGNAKGFGDEPFIYADDVNVRIKLMPILKDQYEIDTVSIHGAKINLAKNKDGKTNWDDLLSGEAEDDSGALPLAAVVLGGVDIQNASFNWTDATTDTKYSLSKLTVKTDALKFGEPLKLALSSDVMANKPDINGNIKLDGTIAYDLDNERYQITPLTVVTLLKGKNIPGGETTLNLSAGIDMDLDKDTASLSGLSFNGLDTKITGELNAAKVQSDEPTVEGKLNVEGGDLAQLFTIAEQNDLAVQVSNIKDRSFNLSTQFNADQARGDVDVSQLLLHMLGANVKGDLKVRNGLSETPEYGGNLNAAGPDLPALLKVLGQFQGGSDSTLSQYADTIAGNKHKKFDVDVSFAADMKSGNVDVSRLAAKLLGATLNGEVRVRSMQSDTPGYKGKLKAAGPDLPTLLQVAGKAQGPESAPAVYGRKLAALKNKAFDINTEFDADMKSGNIAVPVLDINALGITIKGDLRGENIQADKGGISGKLSIQGKDLAPVLKAVEQDALAKNLKSIDVQAGISGNAGNMNLKPLTLRAMVSSEQLKNQTVDVFLNADTNINLADEKKGGALAMKGMTLKGLGLNVSGDIEATKILNIVNGSGPEIQASLNIAPFNLRSLMNTLGQELPDTADKKVFSKVGLTTRFKHSPKASNIEHLDLVLDQSKLVGNLSIQNGDKPAYKFKLDVDSIDIDRYLPPETIEENKPITPETAAGAAAQLPIETLQSLDIDGSLKAGSLKISKARLSNVNLNIKAKDGKISLDPLAANLYKGSYTGKINLNAKEKLPKLVVNSAIKGVQIEPLLKDVTGTADLVGTSDISMALVARGRSTDAFKQTLSGQSELKVVNGILRGIDIPGALEQVEILIEQKRPGKINTEGDTPFSSLTATLPINTGIVTNKDLLMVAPNFQVTGDGTLANLTNMTWKYNLKAGVNERSVSKGQKTYNVGGYKIDIRCRGKVDPNNCKPDAFKLVGEALQKIFLDKLPIPGKNQSGTETNATEKPQDAGKEILDKALKSIFK